MPLSNSMQNESRHLADAQSSPAGISPKPVLLNSPFVMSMITGERDFRLRSFSLEIQYYKNFERYL